jgi:hypothetical protein
VPGTPGTPYWFHFEGVVKLDISRFEMHEPVVRSSVKSRRLQTCPVTRLWKIVEELAAYHLTEMIDSGTGIPLADHAGVDWNATMLNIEGRDGAHRGQSCWNHALWLHVMHVKAAYRWPTTCRTEQLASRCACQGLSAADRLPEA